MMLKAQEVESPVDGEKADFIPQGMAEFMRLGPRPRQANHHIPRVEPPVYDLSKGKAEDVSDPVLAAIFAVKGPDPSWPHESETQLMGALPAIKAQNLRGPPCGGLPVQGGNPRPQGRHHDSGPTQGFRARFS